uniref:SD21618p n=1 Tax=Drosophila melanogaster TaxID=7227 RepID=Q8MRV3_DROME|nr:SD21618p [Drosophila melanogaster]
MERAQQELVDGRSSSSSSSSSVSLSSSMPSSNPMAQMTFPHLTPRSPASLGPNRPSHSSPSSYKIACALSISL